MTKIGTYSLEDYMHLVKSFHGNVAPGLIIGGFMVELAQSHLEPGKLYDAICETQTCLPDAIQLLTPCTVGNGWMKIINFGRYALCLYDKNTLQGVRVYLDPAKLEPWTEIKNWFFKLKSRQEQDINRLQEQIIEAGTSILSIQEVTLNSEKMSKKGKGAIATCPQCGEAYPVRDGAQCLACQGQSPYST